MDDASELTALTSWKIAGPDDRPPGPDQTQLTAPDYFGRHDPDTERIIDAIDKERIRWDLQAWYEHWLDGDEHRDEAQSFGDYCAYQLERRINAVEEPKNRLPDPARHGPDPKDRAVYLHGVRCCRPIREKPSNGTERLLIALGTPLNVWATLLGILIGPAIAASLGNASDTTIAGGMLLGPLGTVTLTGAVYYYWHQFLRPPPAHTRRCHSKAHQAFEEALGALEPLIEHQDISHDEMAIIASYEAIFPRDSASHVIADMQSGNTGTLEGALHHDANTGEQRHVPPRFPRKRRARPHHQYSKEEEENFYQRNGDSIQQYLQWTERLRKLWNRENPYATFDLVRRITQVDQDTLDGLRGLLNCDDDGALRTGHPRATINEFMRVWGVQPDRLFES